MRQLEIYTALERDAPSSALSTLCSYGYNLSFHFFDALRIYATIQFLAYQYVNSAPGTLGDDKEGRPQDSDHSHKVSAPIMIASAVTTVIAKLINAVYSKRHEKYLAAQDYIYAFFSSSIVFVIMNLFSASGYMPSMSPFAFTVVSLVGILAAMAIFFKLTTPISFDRMIFSMNPETQLTYFDDYAKPFPNPSRMARVLNAVGSVGFVASLSTFFWVLNHEMYNGILPLALWQKIVLGLCAVGSAIVGYHTITDHPKYFLFFLMSVVFLNSAAMTYAGYSNIALYLNIKNHPSTIPISVIISFMCGIFSATYIQRSSEDTHNANEKTEQLIVCVGEKMASLFGRCKRCCEKRVEPVDDNILEPELLVAIDMTPVVPAEGSDERGFLDFR